MRCLGPAEKTEKGKESDGWVAMISCLEQQRTGSKRNNRLEYIKIVIKKKLLYIKGHNQQSDGNQ